MRGKKNSFLPTLSLSSTQFSSSHLARGWVVLFWSYSFNAPRPFDLNCNTGSTLGCKLGLYLSQARPFFLSRDGNINMIYLTLMFSIHGTFVHVSMQPGLTDKCEVKT